MAEAKKTATTGELEQNIEAKKEVEPKEETKKVAEKKATKRATGKSNTKKTTTTKKTTKKSADTEKQPTRRKTTKKVPNNVYIEYYGGQTKISVEDYENKIKDMWLNDWGRQAKDLNQIDLYIKPEDGKVYFVINGTEHGHIAI